MEGSRLRKSLEVATNIAVLLVAIAVLGVLALYLYNLHATPQTQLLPGLQRGATVPQVQGLSYRDAPRTLLIAMSTQCGYCKESVPFYHQIVKAEKASGMRTRIVAIFPNSQREVDLYVKQNQLEMDTRAETDFRRLHIAGTPTIILLDGAGVISNFWIGRLSEDDERQLIRALSLT